MSVQLAVPFSGFPRCEASAKEGQPFSFSAFDFSSFILQPSLFSCQNGHCGVCIGVLMKKSSKHSDVSAPQAVTGFIKLQTPTEAIQIGFTDQRISPRAGLGALIGFWHWHRLTELLQRVLPHQPISNNASRPTDTALGFLTGIMAGAKNLAEVARLRGDEVLRKLLRAERLPSQPTLTRFFQVFSGSYEPAHL